MNEKNYIINVGTRKSELAIKQAEIVVESLKKNFNQYNYKLIPISTRGDEVLNSAIPLIGGKNLFTHELEQALLDKKIDIIVHSLKDLATDITEGTCIGAILNFLYKIIGDRRDKKEDVVVINSHHKYNSLNELPPGSIVGTSSVRRISLLKYYYPHLEIKNIRGNLNTRLKKLDDMNYDAVILAAAGLKRLNWENRIRETLQSDVWPYAVCQGIIAVQCRSNDIFIINLLKNITHTETLIEAIMERSMMKSLKGGCSVPVAVNSLVTVDKQQRTIQLTLKGYIFSLENKIDPLISAISCTIPLNNDEDMDNNVIKQSNPPYNICDSILYSKYSYKDVIDKASEIGRNIANNLLENNGSKWIGVAKKTLMKMNF